MLRIYLCKWETWIEHLQFYIDKHVWPLKTALSSNMACQLSAPAFEANVFILLTEVSI